MDVPALLDVIICACVRRMRYLSARVNGWLLVHYSRYSVIVPVVAPSRDGGVNASVDSDFSEAHNIPFHSGFTPRLDLEEV